MSLAAALLASFLLLVGGGSKHDGEGDLNPPGRAFPEQKAPGDAPEWPLGIAHSFEPDSAHQVRIEQRMTIRIAPRAAMPIRRDMFAPMPDGEMRPRFTERKMGKCVPVAGIAGVRPNGGSSLILYMRDRRMVSAALDRTCRARDFYSGFYLSDSSDGMLCVDRDMLQSRSGATCKLSRIRQLVELDE